VIWFANSWRIAITWKEFVNVRIGLKKKSGLFYLSRGQVLSAERAAVKVRRCTTDLHDCPVALKRNLGSNGAAQNVDGRTAAGEPCPAR
jgi:hypothetical protein